MDSKCSWYGRNYAWTTASTPSLKSRGRGIFLDDQLIGINAIWENPTDPDCQDYCSSTWSECGGKYLGALGIPVPCINPNQGSISSGLSLSPHREWIETQAYDWNLPAL